MSIRQDIKQGEGFFVGSRKILSYHVKTKAGVPVNVTGVSMRWVLRQLAGIQSHYQQTGVEVATKTTADNEIQLTGTYDVDPALNTQRVEVIVEAADTAALAPGRYAFTLRRLDDGNVLSEGIIDLLYASA